MKAWIQSADFSVREIEVDGQGAVREFRNHDGSRENSLFEKLESEGKENCPAGLGLVRAGGHHLRICPDGDVAMVHWMKPARLLGFLWRIPKVTTRERVPFSEVSTLIEDFFDRAETDLKSS
ncbi:MAG: hypothetical protein AAF481_18575 [Acidobacteriota bacterium]